MPYSAVNVPITATPAADMVTAIEGVLATHSNWSFVESVTQTDVHRIWKCSGTNNVAGTDFYFAFVLPSTVTSLGVKLFETWDTSAKRMGKQAPGSSGAVPVAADLTTGTSGLLLTDGTTAGSPYAPVKTGISTLVAHTLHCWITKSRLVVCAATPSGNSYMFVAGAFPVQSGITDSRLKNIALMHGTSASFGASSAGSNNGAFTRTAPVGTSTAWDCQVQPVAMGQLEGVIMNATSASLDPLTNRFLSTDVILAGAPGTSTGPGYRGSWPDAIYARMSSTAASSAFGTTVTLTGGADYAYIGYPSWMNQILGGCFLSKSLADT